MCMYSCLLYAVFPFSRFVSRKIKLRFEKTCDTLKLTHGKTESEDPSMNNNLYMSTLLKAFDILDCFTDDIQELGISDISSLVGMPVSSVHRIIQSLEFEGLLVQNRETKKVKSNKQVPRPLSHEGPDGESPTQPDKIVRLSYHVT